MSTVHFMSEVTEVSIFENVGSTQIIKLHFVLWHYAPVFFVEICFKIWISPTQICGMQNRESNLSFKSL